MGNGQALNQDDDKKGQHNKTTQKSELFAYDGKNKIRVALRQVKQFLSAGAQPHPFQPAQGKSKKRLDDLKAASPRVVPGIEIRQNSPEPVRLDDNQKHDGGQPHDQGRKNIAQPEPGQKKHGKRNEENKNHGPQIGLQDKCQ